MAASTAPHAGDVSNGSKPSAMYVLPPPPPSRNVLNQIPLGELNNSIKFDNGPEDGLNLSEGVYPLREDIQLGQIPPHPSDTTPLVTHVLDPNPGPLTSGVKLSLAIIAPRKTSPRQRRPHTGNSTKSSLSQTTDESRDGSAPSSSENGSAALSHLAATSVKTWVFGDGNPALLNVPKSAKDKDKKRKPTSSMVKSSSSFISRVTPHDVPTKRMAEHDPAGIYAFLNINRAFMWLDLSAEDRVGTPATSNMTGLTIEHPKVEPISKILFTKAFALCHDVNKVTLSSTNCDMVMGFNASDFLWWDPPTQKYSRLNKNGAITKSPPIEVKWIPGSENLFMAAHRDGTLIVYDKEKEDAPFVPEDDPSVQSPNRPRMLVRKSIQSKNQKTNPVAHYKIARDRIRGFAFSPAGQHVATVCDDGKLRIIDLAREELVDVQPSYYGALTCVTWSPDGLYLLTGGEDDTVSIWSVTERALVARCNGHKSWVSGVAFDPWRCDDQGNYRFASVGEDCRLLIWDFSPGMLARPRAASVRYNSISSVAVSRSQSSTTVQRLGAATPTQTRKGPSAEALETSPADDDDDDDDNIATNATTSGLAHPVVPRAECPKLPPVLSKIVDVHPLSWLEFTEDSLLVACKSGHVRRWERPAEADESTPMGMHKHNGSLSFANPFVK